MVYTFRVLGCPHAVRPPAPPCIGVPVPNDATHTGSSHANVQPPEPGEALPPCGRQLARQLGQPLHLQLAQGAQGAPGGGQRPVEADVEGQGQVLGVIVKGVMLEQAVGTRCGLW